MKQPSWKAPLILSALLFGIGGFAYWLQYSHKPKKEQQDTQAKKPLALPADNAQIALIKIKSARGLIEIKCDDVAQKKCAANALANWTITYPETFKADSEEVQEFLNSMTTAVATETVDLSADTAEKRKQLIDEYGLSDAKRTDMGTQFVELVLADGKRLTAWFGLEHPLGDKTFVASSENGTINEKTIYLLANHFKTGFTHTVTHFRDKSIFDFDRSLVDAFEAEAPRNLKGLKISAKRENGLWSVNGNPGNYEHIETTLSAIAQAKAKEFPVEDVLKGLSPIILYNLKIKDKVISLSLYEKTIPSLTNKKAPPVKHYYVKTPSKKEVVEVEALFKNQIDKPVAYFRQSAILTETEKVTATRLKIEGPDYKTALEFALEKGVWVQKDNGVMKFDNTLAPKLIDTLTTTRVQEFTSLAMPAASGESITLTIGDDKNPAKFYYRFSVDKGKLYGRDLNSKKNETLIMEEALKNALPFKAETWKQK